MKGCKIRKTKRHIFEVGLLMQFIIGLELKTSFINFGKIRNFPKRGFETPK